MQIFLFVSVLLTLLSLLLAFVLLTLSAWKNDSSFTAVVQSTLISGIARATTAMGMGGMPAVVVVAPTKTWGAIMAVPKGRGTMPGCCIMPTGRACGMETPGGSATRGLPREVTPVGVEMGANGVEGGVEKGVEGGAKGDGDPPPI